MRIVLLGTAWPYRGGLAAFNERLAKQFVQEGHEVEIWTWTLQYPSFLFPGKTQYSTESAPKDLVIRRKLNSCHPLNWWRVGCALRKAAPDRVICCYWMAFFAPCFYTIERIVKRNHHTRCVALVHNMLPHEPSILDKIFAPQFVKETDAFVALSDSVLQDIAHLEGANGTKEGKPKAFYPHPIYDTYGERMSKQEAAAELGLDAEKEYILFFGLVRAYKGLDILLDAMHLLGKKAPTLLIVGEFYENEQNYRNQIAQYHLQDHVVVHNAFVPDADLRKYFGVADLIVQPYRSATQSGVTQVAFHFEKPILVTNVGGLGEIVHHGKMGYAVAPNAQEIANSMADYFENHRQETFTQYLQKEKKKYAWSGMTRTFYQLFEK